MTEAPVEWHPDARLALEAGVPADRLPAWPSRDTLDALAQPSDDSPDT